MDRMLFINLPVADLSASRRFYTGLGFGVNEEYTDDKALCIAIDDRLFVMLLHREFFTQFTPLPVADARESTQVLNCLTAASQAEVDDLAERALAHGGSLFRDLPPIPPMYVKTVTDPDGHAWELLYSPSPDEG